MSTTVMKKRDDNRIENLELMLHGEHTRMHHLGRKASIETRQKQREAKLGKPGNRKGTFASEESKEKNRVAKKLWWKLYRWDKIISDWVNSYV